MPPGLVLTTSFAFGETAEQSFAPTAIIAIAGTPTMAGTYPFTITTNGGGNSVATNYSIMILPPTAASVSVGGRVLNVDRNGVFRAVVTLTDMNGETRTAITNPFGYYRFENISVGETYILSVRSKRYQFAPRVVSVVDELNDLDFTAEPEGE